MESIHEFFDFIGKVITSICGILLRPAITLNIHYCHSFLSCISSQPPLLFAFLYGKISAAIVFSSN
jgi:hypothetical protein